jgi:four helix bundle protein
MLKNFRTYQLAVRFYQATRGLRAPDGLRDQLGRAASSVALNLAEGSGKTSKKDRCRFYEIALGSARECEAILELIQHEGPARQEPDALCRHLFALCRALRLGA